MLWPLGGISVKKTHQIFQDIPCTELRQKHLLSLELHYKEPGSPDCLGFGGGEHSSL